MKEHFEHRESFDGEVVVTVDHEFDESTPFQTVIGVNDQTRIVRNSAVFSMLAKYQVCGVDPQEINLTSRQLDRLIKEANELYGQLDSELGGEVLEVLLDGRIRVALLIDSDGGYMDVANDMVAAMLYWSLRGGECQSYVYGHAHSAAFELMMKSDKRLVMAKSSLLWHFSDVEGERRQGVAGLRESQRVPKRIYQEYIELQEFFRSSRYFLESDWALIMEEIVDEENPEGELVFNGEELKYWGLVRSYHRLKTLFAYFRSQFVLADVPEVRDFWTLSALIDAEMRHTRWWTPYNFEGLRVELAQEEVFQQKQDQLRKRLVNRPRRPFGTVVLR